MAGTHQSNYFKWKQQGGVEVGWQDRASTYPSRRQLTHVSGTAGSVEVVEVSRSPEDVRIAGDAFSATNMNDLEKRIDTAMGQMESVFRDGVDRMYQACVARGVTPSASTPEAIEAAILSMYSPTAYANNYSAGRAQGHADRKDNVTVGSVAFNYNSGSGTITVTVGGGSKVYNVGGMGMGTEIILASVDYNSGVTNGRIV